MEEKLKLLFVDDEEGYRNALRRSIRILNSVMVETAADGLDALKRLKIFPADIVITDLVMPNIDGMGLLKKVRERYPEIFVVVVTGRGSVESAVEAMKAGAYDYIQKPFELDQIRSVLEKIARHHRILHENVFFPSEHRKTYRFENIIGQDSKMFDIFQKIVDVAKTDATVLLTGESGTGKELIAEAIHYRSRRREKPFIKVNSGAFTETLINSELFGHEKGSFTGAVVQKKGIFEVSDSGTIFLDEIGTVPVSTQVSLLRVLEQRSYNRVGGIRPIRTDIRVICATNENLWELVKERRFREDLLYRINVVSIHVPPLRERKSDIPLLAGYYLKKFAGETKKNIRGISKAAMRLLIRYGWPGNVRELANVIESSVIFCKTRQITPQDLSREVKDTDQNRSFTLRLSSNSLPQAESKLIRKVLEETNWNLNRAAQELSIARGTLYSKMKKFGIERKI